MSTTKPIQDWTLKEIVAECHQHEVCFQGCRLYTGLICGVCRITGAPPDEWGVTP